MKDFKIKNACDVMGQENQIWSEIVTNSNFSGKCPIAAVFKIKYSRFKL